MSARRRSFAWTGAAISAYAALVPLQPVMPMSDGSFLRFAASDAIAPFIFLAAVLRPTRRASPGLTAIAIALAMLALFSTLLAARERDMSQYALGKTAGLFYLVLLSLAIARCLESVPDLLRAIARGALWSAIVGLGGMVAWWRGIHTQLVNYDRLCSTMVGDPNIYCSLLAVGLIIVAVDPRLARAGRIGRVGLLGAAVLATGSRSGLLGLVAGIFVCLLVRSRDQWVTGARALYTLTAVGLVTITLALAPSGTHAAYAIVDHVWRTWTVENRFELYARALQLFSDNPVLGLGIGGFKDLNAWDHGGHGIHFAVHNTYLWALVDLGVGGGFLVPALIGAAILVCVRAARRVPPLEGAAVVAGGLVAMSVFNLFIDGLYQRHFWLLLACALTMSVARRGVPVSEHRRGAQEMLAYGVAR